MWDPVVNNKWWHDSYLQFVYSCWISAIYLIHAESCAWNTKIWHFVVWIYDRLLGELCDLLWHRAGIAFVHCLEPFRSEIWNTIWRSHRLDELVLDIPCIIDWNDRTIYRLSHFHWGAAVWDNCQWWMQKRCFDTCLLNFCCSISLLH